MKKLFIIALVFIVQSLTLNACDCSSTSLDSLQKKFYKNSDIVFLGEIIEIDTINMKVVFIVYETFKSKNENKKISVVYTSSSCSYLPTGKGLWIVYGKYNNDSTISISTCSPTRSNISPFISSVNTLPYLPEKFRKKELEEFRFKYIIKREEAIVEWYNELYKLRNSLL